MKVAALGALLVLSACNSVASPAPPAPSPSSAAEAIGVTKQFWKQLASAWSSGTMEPMAGVCEEASLAWAHTIARIAENHEKGELTEITGRHLKSFVVTSDGKATIVRHRLDLKGRQLSASTRLPLEPEQEWPPLRITVRLERFGAALLVTDFRDEPLE